MRLIILESPFRGRTWAETYRFEIYCRRCIRDSINRGESPYASHAILPGALDDNNPEERQKGIEAGYAWWNKAETIVFYIDHGISEGMFAARERANKLNLNWELRSLANNPD